MLENMYWKTGSNKYAIYMTNERHWYSKCWFTKTDTIQFVCFDSTAIYLRQSTPCAHEASFTLTGFACDTRSGRLPRRVNSYKCMNTAFQDPVDSHKSYRGRSTFRLRTVGAYK